MDTHTLLDILNLLIQMALFVVAVIALKTWKSELRGKNEYTYAKTQLDKLQNISFELASKHGLHFIYLNDILTDKKQFFHNQIASFAEEEVLVDSSLMNLHQYLGFETRSNLTLSQKLRDHVNEVLPGAMLTKSNKGKTSKYMRVRFPKSFTLPKGVGEKEHKDDLYILNDVKVLTYKEYFEKWEVLLKELHKLT